MIIFRAIHVALWAFALGLYTAGAVAQTPPSANSTLEQELGAEVDRFVEADRAAPPAACQVLFVGSSSIVKWKDSLAADMAPMPVINRGFGGSHIEYVNRWFDAIGPARLPFTLVRTILTRENRLTVSWRISMRLWRVRRRCWGRRRCISSRSSLQSCALQNFPFRAGSTMPYAHVPLGAPIYITSTSSHRCSKTVNPKTSLVRTICT